MPVYINLSWLNFQFWLQSEAMSWLIGIYQLFLLCLCKDIMDSQGLIDSDDARNIMFLVPVKDSALVGHVIANKTVHNMEQCETECFLIGDCISLNFDTRTTSSPNCQLSASDKNMHPEDFKLMSGYIYQGSKNGCLKNAGTACNKPNVRCQSGFGRRGFRCICKKCFHGKDCQTYTKDTVLHFSSHSVDQVVVIFKTIPNLVAYTVGLWLQMKKETGKKGYYPTVISVVGDDNKDQLALFFSNDDYLLTLEFQSSSRRRSKPEATHKNFLPRKLNIFGTPQHFWERTKRFVKSYVQPIFS